MDKEYHFEVSAYGCVTHSEVISYLVDTGRITKEQADSYTPTPEDIRSCAMYYLCSIEDDIRIEFGERFLLDYEGNIGYEEV